MSTIDPDEPIDPIETDDALLGAAFEFDESAANSAIRVGTALVALVERYADWITRRAEVIELLNHAVARRSSKVDISLPGVESVVAEIGASTLDGFLPLPIALLDGMTHTTIDVRDESGAVLPRLNRVEERHLLKMGLIHLARSRLKPNVFLAGSIKSAISTIVDQRDWADGREQLLKCAPQLVADDQPFRLTAEQVADSHFLIVLLDPSGGQRRVVNYEVMEEILPPQEALEMRGRARADQASERETPPTPTSDRPVQRGESATQVAPYYLIPAVVRGLARAWSWYWNIGERRFVCSTPSAGDCVTYHLDMPAPYDLDICDANFVAETPAPDAQTFERADDSCLTTRAHIFVSIRNRVVEGYFTSMLRLLPTSVVRSSVYSSLFSLGTIAAGLAYVCTIENHALSKVIDTESGVAVLLLVPGIVAGALATPSRHSMTTQLLFPTRSTLAASGLASFLVAVAVGAKVNGALAVSLWSVAAGLAAACALRICAQYRRLRRSARAASAQSRSTGRNIGALEKEE